MKVGSIFFIMIILTLGFLTYNHYNRKKAKHNYLCESRYGKGSEVIKPGLFSSYLCKSAKDENQLRPLPRD